MVTDGRALDNFLLQQETVFRGDPLIPEKRDPQFSGSVRKSQSPVSCSFRQTCGSLLNLQLLTQYCTTAPSVLYCCLIRIVLILLETEFKSNTFSFKQLYCDNCHNDIDDVDHVLLPDVHQ